MQATTHDLTDELIGFLRDYYEEEVAELAQHYPREQKSLYIDYDDIYQFDRQVANDLRESPEQMLEYFDEALRLYDLPADVSLDDANVRVHNLPDEEIHDVDEVSRHSNIGKLLGVRGQVQKASKVRPRVVEGVFDCRRCGTQSHIPQSGDDLQWPHECQGCERQGPFDLNESASTWTNHQFARIQQPPERAKGGKGQTINVDLEGDVIQQFDAGDRVTLTSILGVENAGDDQSREFDTRLDAQAVTREQSDYEDIEVEEHLDEIKAIASGERGDPYELLIDSINPQHYGDRDVKLAIALQLFGGWSRDQQKRGDSHILLMGDPGCGKSTFLQAIDELAPRSTYASGKGATASGLTAAVVPDDFGNTKWSLEAGALVLADGGVACIDEIDKVKDEAVSSMHDALESQKVRVNKAGIDATLNSRTALLAAGNPKHGRFDSYEAFAQQLDMGPTLLSRFDLMFMVSDSPDPEVDRDIIDHMMTSRRAAAKKSLGEELTEKESQSIEPEIPKEVLRAYIAYAKQEVTPYIQDENDPANEYLQDEFLKLRLANDSEEPGEENPIPVTFRSEEGIERLAEACARVRLSDEVTKQDVDRALSLVKKSMRQLGIDPETGEFDADVIETGQSKSQRSRRKQIMAVIEDKAPTTEEEIADVLDIEHRKVEQDVEELRNRVEVFEGADGLRPT